MNGQPSSRGEPLPERRLAGAAQPDQRDPPRAVGRGRSPLARRSISSAIAGSSAGGMRPSRSRMWVIAAVRPLVRGEQLDDRHIERLGDRLEDDHGRIALPALDLREITLGRAGLLRQLAPGHAALGAARAAPAGRRRRRTPS